MAPDDGGVDDDDVDDDKHKMFSPLLRGMTECGSCVVCVRVMHTNNPLPTYDANGDPTTLRVPSCIHVRRTYRKNWSALVNRMKFEQFSINVVMTLCFYRNKNTQSMPDMHFEMQRAANGSHNYHDYGGRVHDCATITLGYCVSVCSCSWGVVSVGVFRPATH